VIVRYRIFCRDAEFFSQTNRRNRSAQFGERESWAIGLGFRCVVLEEDRRIVAVCADRHFADWASVQALDWLPVKALLAEDRQEVSELVAGASETEV
jgi:hypothetical protein